jgi:hypothetical protein
MIKHARCESFSCIDVRELQRENRLRPNPTVLLWSSDGAASDVAMIAELHVLSVFHPCLVDGVKKWATQSIPIHWAKCHFGGQRPWFNCPIRKCHRRVAKLYWTDGCFVCRCCLGLAYESQQLNPGVRAARRAEKIRARLGGTVADPFRVKPRGMHWRTYQRLCEEAEHAEAAVESSLLGSLERAAKRFNDPEPVPQPGDGWRRRSPP